MSDNEKTAEKAQQMIQDLILAGFSGVKISKGSGVNQITIGNLKNGKNSRVTEVVFDKLWDFWSENVPPQAELEKLRAEKGQPASASAGTRAQKTPEKATASIPSKPAPSKPKRKYTKRTKQTAPPSTSFINKNYVPVDINALTATVDSLIDRFSEAVKELEAIRKQIK